MIDSISIQNLGVIEATELNFGAGLTVLTGETGAGKTMVLTSVNLLLGRRADPGIVRAQCDNAHVDGIFTVDEQLCERAKETGAELEDNELIISRTVAAKGRSRARIGGRPVPANVLAEIAEELVTIHGQADQILLKGTHAQRHTLDSYGSRNHLALLSSYQQAWAGAVQAKKALDEALSSVTERETEIASLQKALEIFDELGIYAGEEDDLRAETERLMNVEDLRTYISRARANLQADDTQSAIELTRAAAEEVRQASRFDSEIDDYERRLTSLRLELEGIADDLATYMRNLEADPQRLAQLHQRRAALRDLMRGRAADSAELIEWADSARLRLAQLTDAAASPEECEQHLLAAQRHVREIGAKLSESRRNLARKLETAVTRELHGLAMPQARFLITFESHKPAPFGLEDIVFMLQPHPDMNPTPIGQGASGGELSRVMLALEVTLGGKSGTPTYIFDEVDAGIGGRTASEVGKRLAQLAQHKQVIVVTHLAQVAAWASTHLVVEKDGATTHVRAVHGEERVSEITRMMGAEESSDVARRHAKELLDGVNVEEFIL